MAVVLASLLALPAAARADDVLNPPGGPVFVEANNPQPERVDRPDRPDRPGRDPQQKHKNQALKHALMQQFDMNGDGRLGPRERMRAARVLGRIQQKLAGRDGAQGRLQAQGQRPQKMRRFVKRFDTNHDGTVDQSEMPPGAARKLRRLDGDRDGWVEPSEVK